MSVHDAVQPCLSKSVMGQQPCTTTCAPQILHHYYCRAVKGKDGEAVHETELHSELQRLKAQMTAIDASIAAARSQLENLKKEDERTVWETNIVILKASQLRSKLRSPLSHLFISVTCSCGPDYELLVSQSIDRSC